MVERQHAPGGFLAGTVGDVHAMLATNAGKQALTARLLGVGDGPHRLDAGAAQAPRLEVALCRCRVGKQRAVKSGLLSSLCTASLDASVQLAVLHWEALKAATPPPQLPAAHP